MEICYKECCSSAKGDDKVTINLETGQLMYRFGYTDNWEVFQDFASDFAEDVWEYANFNIKHWNL
jgi:hypothetical protein